MGENQIVKLSFTGDILCYQSQNLIASLGDDKFDYSYMLKPILDDLSNTDYLCGSLETPLAGAEAGYTNHSKNFNTPDDFAEYLKICGFNHLTTANNHCLDRGVEGLDRTIEVLDKLGIEHSGTYISEEDEHHIFIKDLKGVKVAILSYTYGTNSRSNKNYLSNNQLYKVDLLRRQERQIVQNVSIFRRIVAKIFKILKPVSGKLTKPVIDNVPASEIHNPSNIPYIERFVNKIKKAKETSDIVVLCLHSGGQFNFYEGIGDYTKYIMDIAVENKVDFVIGNHAHCVLPSSILGNSYIFYALGNFCFTPGEGYYVNDTLADYSILLHFNIDVAIKRVVGYEFSLLKCIKDIEGRTIVKSVFDLYNNTNNSEEEKTLKNDALKVFNQFTNSNLSNLDIQRSYSFPVGINK
jgi:poly-gamma-glutamate synthesis protein (capsule biosynthesis protein)